MEGSRQTFHVVRIPCVIATPKGFVSTFRFSKRAPFATSKSWGSTGVQALGVGVVLSSLSSIVLFMERGIQEVVCDMRGRFGSAAVFKPSCWREWRRARVHDGLQVRTASARCARRARLTTRLEGIKSDVAPRAER